MLYMTGDINPHAFYPIDYLVEHIIVYQLLDDIIVMSVSVRCALSWSIRLIIRPIIFQNAPCVVGLRLARKENCNKVPDRFTKHLNGLVRRTILLILLQPSLPPSPFLPEAQAHPLNWRLVRARLGLN